MCLLFSLLRELSMHSQSIQSLSFSLLLHSQPMGEVVYQFLAPRCLEVTLCSARAPSCPASCRTAELGAGESLLFAPFQDGRGRDECLTWAVGLDQSFCLNSRAPQMPKGLSHAGVSLSELLFGGMQEFLIWTQ